METQRYTQRELDIDDYAKKRTVIVSQTKMLAPLGNDERRDRRWRVRIARTKLDDTGKKVHLKRNGKKLYDELDYAAFMQYLQNKNEPDCVEKDKLWTSTNPNHRWCEYDDEDEVKNTVTKAQMISKWYAQRVKSDRKARQTDRKKYKDVKVIDLTTGKKYKFQVQNGTTIEHIHQVLKSGLKRGNEIIWYDRAKYRFSDYKKRDPWKSNKIQNNYYLTHRRKTKEKPPKDVVIDEDMKSILNKHFSHRRIVWVVWNDGKKYCYCVKSSDTFADLAKLYSELHDKPDAKFKVDERELAPYKLVWDATSKAQMVYLVE